MKADCAQLTVNLELKFLKLFDFPLTIYAAGVVLDQRVIVSQGKTEIFYTYNSFTIQDSL